MGKRIPMSQEGRRRAAVRQRRMEKAGKVAVVALAALTAVLVAIQF